MVTAVRRRTASATIASARVLVATAVRRMVRRRPAAAVLCPCVHMKPAKTGSEARTRAALARRRPAAAGLCPCVQGMIARTISRESTRAARRPRRRTRHPVLIPRHPLGRGSGRPIPAPLPRPPLLCRRPSPSPVQIVKFDVTGSPTPALDSGQGFTSGSRSADPWSRVPSGNVWAPVGGRLPDGSSNPYYIQVSGDGGACAAPVPIDAEADAASTP